MFSELEHGKEQLKRTKGKVESDSWKVRIAWNRLNLIQKKSGVFLTYETLTCWKLSSLSWKAKILLNPEYSYEKWEGTDANLL